MSKKAKPQGLVDRKIIAAAAVDSVRKFDPRALAKNPVIFVTEVVSVLVALFFVRDLIANDGVASFTGQIAAWLWFTVLFANFAEAVAEGRGKAQVDTLRRAHRHHRQALRHPSPAETFLDGPPSARRARPEPRATARRAGDPKGGLTTAEERRAWRRPVERGAPAGS